MAATAPTTERPEGRRRRVPPAPPWRVGGSSGAALEVLTDFERAAPQHEAAAFALWKALRDVHLWHTLPPERRARAFPGARSLTRADLDAALTDCPELALAWAAFARLLDDVIAVEAPELAAACHAVYTWTEQRSLLDTAAHFAEAAALLAPNDPPLNNYAGWACRRAVLHARSEAWHDRTLTLAVLADNQAEAVRAIFALATLRKDQGRTDEARGMYEEAVRRARWTKKRRLGAMAQHHLFALIAETGHLEEGLRQAKHAIDLCPVYSDRFPALVHDLSFLLVRCGLYSYALPLLERLPATAFALHEQLAVESTLAMAAAGLGRSDRFRVAEARVRDLLRVTDEHGVKALIHLAQGAARFREWTSARNYATEACILAQKRHDAPGESEARELLRLISCSTRVPTAYESPETDELVSVTRQFGVRLRRWMAPIRRRVGPQIADCTF